MTIHSAKGRQWRAVIVAGVEEGLLPHKSAKSPEARQEEGRLAYVAFTRAADELFISWTDRRSGRRTGPSPLLRRLQTGPERIVAPPDEIRADIRRRLRAPAPDPVLEALRVWRRDAARASRVAEQGVLSDRELSTLAQARPRTEDEVVAVLGPILGRRHSRRLLQVIASVESDGS